MANVSKIPLVLQRPGVIGVFADEVLMSRSDSRVGLTFVQVYDVVAAEGSGQVAALVYLTVDKAGAMVKQLAQLLSVE